MKRPVFDSVKKRKIGALGVAALTMFALAAPQATAKRAPKTGNKQATPAAGMRLIDVKEEAPGGAYAAQWDTFARTAAARRAGEGKAPMFGESELYAKFSALTGAPRVLYGDLGEAPAAARVQDRALLFLEEQAHVFGIRTSDLEPRRAVEGGGKPLHYFYDQKYQGLPVFYSEVAVHMDQHGRVWALNNTYVPVSLSKTAPELTPAEARAISVEACGAATSDLLLDHMIEPILGVWPTSDGGRLAWKNIVSVRMGGTYEVMVDALTGEILEQPFSLDCTADGVGKVFTSNPVVSQSNDALRDNQTVPEAAYLDVTLTNLNASPNDKLIGTYSRIATDHANQVSRAGFNFSDLRRNTTPANAQFNQENAYWAYQFAQSTFQGLGYSAANGNAIMNYAIRFYSHVSPHFGNADNSHFSGDQVDGPGTGHNCYGTGGVDDAEDVEIIWHELGHAMLYNQRPGINQNLDCEGMGEGFGDYFAGALSKRVSGNSSYYVTVGEWDATSYSPSASPHPNLRTLHEGGSTGRFYPNSSGNCEVHVAGETWSHALFDYDNQAGTDTALDVILQANFLLDLSPTQPEGAAAMITADQMLNGGATAGLINNAFRERRTVAGTVTPVVHTVGGYQPGSPNYFLRQSCTAGPGELTINFGSAALTPLTGDWDGNGSDTIAAYDSSNGTWFVKNSNAPGAADLTFFYGSGGSNLVPLVGDWDGDGDETPGLYNTSNGFFFLKNTNAGGSADMTFQFGTGGVNILPVVGDWDGNGTDTIAIFNNTNGFYFLKNTNAGGSADMTFQFGTGGAAFFPVAGDWDGNGTNTVGFYDSAAGFFFLKNTNAGGPADHVFAYGAAGFRPLTGDWNGPIAH